VSGREGDHSIGGLAPAIARGSAAVSAREAFGLGVPLPPPSAPPSPRAMPRRAPKPGPSPRGACDPAPGPYLGGAASATAHRVSFSVLGDRMRNLRVDGRAMAPNARIVGGKVEAHHMGFEVTAEWLDESHVEGTVRMRGRWGRPVSFGFTARLRVGDVLSG
jgi:hypothetical protein